MSAPEVRHVQIGGRTVVLADPLSHRVFELIQTRVAPAEMPVLIQGETGTGKEVVAAAIHAWSPRKSAAIVALNCAALPDHLVESELFGFERGAFSGADVSRRGLFEEAHRGVLMLDEIGELSATSQAKLLRALETKRVRPIGASQERPADVRVVAATNRNLDDEVKAGRFRRDLFFRLKGATISLTPLRRRPRDILPIARAALGPSRALTESAAQLLLAHDWPGNVRELLSCIEYLISAGESQVDGRRVEEWLGRGNRSSIFPGKAGDLPRLATPSPAPVPAQPTFRPIADEIAELEKSRMEAALRATGGQRTKAAELISMPLRTFATKLKLYGLQ